MGRLDDIIERNKKAQRTDDLLIGGMNRLGPGRFDGRAPSPMPRWLKWTVGITVVGLAVYLVFIV